MGSWKWPNLAKGSYRLRFSREAYSKLIQTHNKGHDYINLLSTTADISVKNLSVAGKKVWGISPEVYRALGFR